MEHFGLYASVLTLLTASFYFYRVDVLKNS